MEIKKEKLIKEAVKTWGIDSQIDLVIEEMAELIQALIKLRRSYDKDDKTKEDAYVNVCEEIADVKLMIEQMEDYFSNELIDDFVKEKLVRLNGLLKKHRKNEGNI